MSRMRYTLSKFEWVLDDTPPCLECPTARLRLRLSLVRWTRGREERRCMWGQEPSNSIGPSRGQPRREVKASEVILPSICQSRESGESGASRAVAVLGTWNRKRHLDGQS